jgi:glycosyltransferase involved in cell wall biosynthesis
MKIAYISGAYIPDRGADSVHVMSMCQALAALGQDVTLLVRPGKEPVADDFTFYGVRRCFRIVKIDRPQVRVWGALVNARHAGKRSAKEAPDLIYAREPYGLSFAIRSGIPFVYESHWVPRHFVERALFRWMFAQPNFRKVVFISKCLRELWRKQIPSLRDDQTLVLHDAANLLEAVGLPTVSVPVGRMQIGYVGAFLPGYGIEIIAELAKRNPQWDFHIVGGREPAIREFRERTASIPTLKFHGFVPPGLLHQQYRTFDAVLAPYQAATRHIDWISPMKLFEYMAHRKAIVCADFPVMREILEHEQDALLVDPANLDAYRDALIRLTDPALRERLATNARAKMEREFTWQRRAERLLATLTSSPSPKT